VDRERVARQQHVDVAAADQIAEVGAAASVDDDRPGGEAIRSPPPSQARIAAMRETPTSTRRSDEISLVMNAKPWRSRSWNSGTILMPWMPQTIASPLRISRSLRQIARGPSITIRRPCAAADLDPLAAEPHRGLMVGGRVEVLRRAAVAIGGDGWASSARATRQPSATSSSSTSVSAGGAFAVTRIDTNDGSSLVRPIRNSSTSNAASWRTTVSAGIHG
jgi:hypothetical protein